MNDLDRLFRALDEMPTTDLSRSVEHRAATGFERIDLKTTRKPPRRLVAAVVAFAVFGTAAFFAWQVLQPLQVVPAPGDPTPSTPWASYSQGWNELPSPPVVHQGAALVWTASELLYWGGREEGKDVLNAGGYGFDPTDGTWVSLPTAPLALGDATGVWTGTEAIFLGYDDPDGSTSGGLAFNPTTGSWRIIADAPSLDPAGSVTAWTGTELIRFGGGKAGDPSNVEGIAYDPVSDAWTRIADAPIGLNAASAVWDGHEMIVFGSLLNGGNHAASVAAVGEAYDPATDSWRPIAASTLSPQATSAVWVPGLGMFAWDYATEGAWYDPATDSWGDQQKLPLEAGECYPDSVRATIRSVFAFYCGNVAVYDPAEDRWMRVGGGLTDVTIEANGKPYQMYRFASLAEAGDVVALAATGITVESGVPCYGCPGAPTSFWVYKTVSASPTPGVFFPTGPEQDGVSMDALYQGSLVVRDGCVLIGRPGDYTLPIWRSGSTVERDGSGRLTVRDATGTVVAVEGVPVEMGGGYIAEFRPENEVEPRDDQIRRVEEWLGYSIPERCLGPEVYGLWSVGAIS